MEICLLFSKKKLREGTKSRSFKGKNSWFLLEKIGVLQRDWFYLYGKIRET
jgi:hypothetical protein